jgi:hypothetical protein
MFATHSSVSTILIWCCLIALIVNLGHANDTEEENVSSKAHVISYLPEDKFKFLTNGMAFSKLQQGLMATSAKEMNINIIGAQKQVIANEIKPARIFHQVTCPDSLENSKCTRFERALNNSISRIDKVLELKESITISVSFFSPCNETGIETTGQRCEFSHILGAATPAGFIPIRFAQLVESGPNDPRNTLPRRIPENAFVPKYMGVFYVPQALVKQLDIHVPEDFKAASFAKADIHASFNSQIDWWVTGDRNPMSATQEDLEFTILHEVMVWCFIYRFLCVLLTSIATYALVW